MNRKTAFVMVWWNAYGNACQSDPMDKEAADIALASMHPSQEARLMLVYRSIN